ncbi:hypothetical protein EG68_12380 [Paragonimus skrjabini miyazakii]|uniref:Uncharacterized protein n=1 Tax=Paragonimus skrjabini miyazakii TaxID=59628 RepID=A0A8S9YCV3_9TREM|nr:hypothetical protein EG68_12380 [Paragonimus skrjabini miyazakii]
MILKSLTDDLRLGDLHNVLFCEGDPVGHIARMAIPFSMQGDVTSAKHSGFFSGIYGDQYKWSLLKCTVLFGVGVFGFFVINEAFNCPQESL